MKTVIFVCEGMADRPLQKLSGKTPLETAFHHNIDLLATYGTFGQTHVSGSPSPFGFDPGIYTARDSAYEAVSCGAALDKDDLSYSCTAVHLSDADSFENAVMLDCGTTGTEHFTAADAVNMVKTLSDRSEFYAGRGYKHSMVLRNGDIGGEQTPPCEALGKRIGDVLPKGRNSQLLIDIMSSSYESLRGFWKNGGEGTPVNCLWLWNESRAAALPSFKDTFGIAQGAVVAAEDRIHGIAACAGLDVIRVPGATGDVHTKYAKKAEAAIKAFDTGAELVFIHVNAPADCALRGRIRDKVYAIEQIDEKIIGTVLRYLEDKGDDFTALCLSAGAASLEEHKYIDMPVPFAYYKSWAHPTNKALFNEPYARQAGFVVKEAFELLPQILKKPE